MIIGYHNEIPGKGEFASQLAKYSNNMIFSVYLNKVATQVDFKLGIVMRLENDEPNYVSVSTLEEAFPDGSAGVCIYERIRYLGSPKIHRTSISMTPNRYRFTKLKKFQGKLEDLIKSKLEKLIIGGSVIKITRKDSSNEIDAIQRNDKVLSYEEFRDFLNEHIKKVLLNDIA